jgi:hypothetical protein
MLNANSVTEVQQIEQSYYGGEFFLHFNHLSERVKTLIARTTLPFVIDTVPNFDPEQIMPANCQLCRTRKPHASVFGSGNLNPDIVVLPLFDPHWQSIMTRHYGTIRIENLVKRTLQRYGLLPHSWIQPVVMCQSVDTHKEFTSILPTFVELRTCYPYVRMAITGMNPERIIVLTPLGHEIIADAYVDLLMDSFGKKVHTVRMIRNTRHDVSTKEDMANALYGWLPTIGATSAR